MGLSQQLMVILFAMQLALAVNSEVSSYQSKRQLTSMYYLAYCPIRQGNYITYSNAMCYCRRGGTNYDCRPVIGNQSVSFATQRPPGRPQGTSLPPLNPPPVAPPPPPPPNRPSTPPNVDTRPSAVLIQRFSPSVKAITL